VACCISVLEHLPDPAAVVEQFARVLAPSGLLILTFDIAREPAATLGLDPARRTALLARMSEHFDIAYPNGFVHPASMLTTARGPYPMYRHPSSIKAVWKTAKEKILKPILGRPPAVRLSLACEGLVAVRSSR